MRGSNIYGRRVPFVALWSGLILTAAACSADNFTADPDASVPDEGGTTDSTVDDTGVDSNPGDPDAGPDVVGDVTLQDVLEGGGDEDVSFFPDIDAPLPDVDAGDAGCPPLPDSMGTFVSPGGTGTIATGCTISAPCAKIQDAIDYAYDKQPVNVYIDDGTYTEQITLTTKHLQDVFLEGGWKRQSNGSWTHACNTTRPVTIVAPSVANVTVKTSTTPGSWVLRNLNIQSRASAPAAGESLYGLVASSGAHVVLENVGITVASAGGGTTGSNGLLGTPAPTTCAAGTVMPKQPPAGAPGTGAPMGTWNANGYVPQSGTGVGATGAQGPNGTIGDGTLGTTKPQCNSDPGAPATCEDCAVDQGPPAFCSDLGPSSGHCGGPGIQGCGSGGGTGGGPGTGGGSSVGVLVTGTGASVTVAGAGAVIVTGNGGTGGAGGPGGGGGPVQAGTAGTPYRCRVSCPNGMTCGAGNGILLAAGVGSAGALGGVGGIGGGGAGGWSFGAYVVAGGVYNDDGRVTYSPGSAGPGGAGGSAASGMSGNHN